MGKVRYTTSTSMPRLDRRCRPNSQLRSGALYRRSK